MVNRYRNACLVVAAVLVLAVSSLARAEGIWGEWPANANPKEVGRKVVNNLIARTPSTRPYGYQETCTAYGAFRFVDAIKDKELFDKLMERYGVMLTEEGKRVVRRNPTNVDSSIWGALPLKMYQLTNDKRYLDLGLHCADYQWDTMPDFGRISDENRRKELEANAKSLMAQGLTPQTRFWIDDMFMITGLQLNAYRATKDKKYLDRAAHEMVAYLDKLQQPNGLFFHHAENAQFFWGRGDGWVAVGMTEMLMDLPSDHPNHAAIAGGYKKMMAALKKYQGADGMWKQLIDHEEFWPESSCTGMFTFAMANGLKRGWLDAAEYKETVRKAWPALCGYMDENGNMKEVCEGTNVNKDIDYYMKRQRKLGDFHGQAAMLWAAWSVLE